MPPCPGGLPPAPGCARAAARRRRLSSTAGGQKTPEPQPPMFPAVRPQSGWHLCGWWVCPCCMQPSPGMDVRACADACAGHWPSACRGWLTVRLQHSRFQLCYMLLQPSQLIQHGLQDLGELQLTLRDWILSCRHVEHEVVTTGQLLSYVCTASCSCRKLRLLGRLCVTRQPQAHVDSCRGGCGLGKCCYSHTTLRRLPERATAAPPTVPPGLHV